MQKSPVKPRPLFVAVPLAALTGLAACAHAAAPRAPAGFALSRAAAVELCLPPGEVAWLKALRCPDGQSPRVERKGTIGPRTEVGPLDGERALLQMDPGRPLERGEPDLHVIDAVEAGCGARTTALYLDMYHCAQPPPRVAPAGFGFESPGD